MRISGHPADTPFTSENAAPDSSAAASVVPATLRGREYLRVSQDNSGRQRSVTEQHNDDVRATSRHSIWENSR